MVLVLDIRTASVTDMQNDTTFMRTSRFGGSLVEGYYLLFSWLKRGKDICYVWHAVQKSHDIILNSVQKVMSYDIK